MRNFGKGRVFFTNLGHNGSTWENETYQKHLVAGFKWSLKLTDGPAEPNPEVQAQQSIKAFALFASQKLKLNQAELAKKMQAKAGNAEFIKLLRENSWKSKGRDMKLIQEVLDALN